MNSFVKLAAALLCAALPLISISAQTSLVSHGGSWRYRKGTSAPPADWKTAADASLDASWLTGNGGIGYADNATETSQCKTILTDMKGSYSSVAMRTSFQITSAVDANLHLTLTMDWDDGFIAWLDGVYLGSANSPGAPAEPAFNAPASALHESSRGNSSPQPAMTFDFGAVGSRLPVGAHVLAIIGLNENATSSDFIQIADLSLATSNPQCVSGAIAANMTWHAADSPIDVCGSVTINNGVTLTIEPGVTVQLGAGVNLTVANGGRLLAEGTSNAPIRFTRSGASGNWGNLTINGAVGSPETRITQARFEFNANNTGTPCIEVAAGTAYLDHLTFGNTGAPYIHVDGASFIISDCFFPSASTQFELCHGTGGIKSGGHGIFQRNFFGLPIGYNDVVDFTGGNRPGQPIVHFINNVFSGASDDILDVDGTDAWIEGNIFLHSHKNGAPDSSAAISGGNDSTRTSEVTIIGNLIYDCDEAATAKQGNFFTLFNNTIVHTTKTGGNDTASGVVNVRDLDPGPPTTFGVGFYLEGNIIVDAEQLVRNYVAGQTTVTFNNNILPMAWSGPGGGNAILNPLLKHIPQLAETHFTSWEEAQILWDWFSLLPGSPALGTGPNGQDKGGVIPRGASISGEPNGSTSQTTATLTVGLNRTGYAISTIGWPNGSGYTHYKWRLDSGPWSAETPIASHISITGLAEGSHYVEVTGKQDSGLYQDDPLFAEDALITRSPTWLVFSSPILSIARSGPDAVLLQFTAEANTGYTIEYRDSLSLGTWQALVHLDPIPSKHSVIYTDPFLPGTMMRFYRLAQ